MKPNNTSKSEIHLIFRLGKNIFGIPISKASNILEISRMTSIKNSDDLVIGNVTLRGSFIPIVNLHSKFGTKLDNFTNNNSVLVLETNSDSKFLIGIIIDALLEAIEIKTSEIDCNVEKEINCFNNYIKGYYRRNKQMNVGIIELENIFTNDEMLVLKKSNN